MSNLPDHVDRPATHHLPLQTHVEELVRRRETVGRFQGGHTSFLEQCRIFETYVEEQGFHFDTGAFGLGRSPDDEGNEHQVWFDEASRFFWKLTWPDFFGLKVLYRQDEDERCSPIEYLERWHWHNECFGDQVEFWGVCRVNEGIRLAIRQPAIEGTPMDVPEIAAFFTSNGWQPFSVDGNLAFYDSQRRMAISDTHPGNLIRMADGLAAPIDLRVQLLDDVLADAVEELCREELGLRKLT